MDELRVDLCVARIKFVSSERDWANTEMEFLRVDYDQNRFYTSAVKINVKLRNSF